MATTKTKKGRKNKKMKLLKNIEGGDVGRLKINQTYLNNRMDYTYAYIFPENLRSQLGDDSQSPLYLLATSANADSKSQAGSNPFLTAGVKIANTPVEGFGTYYKNYLTGNFQRAAEYETIMASTGDQIVSALASLGDTLFGWMGFGKPGHKKKLPLKKRLKIIKEYNRLRGEGTFSKMAPPAATVKSTYDEFKERTELPNRIGVLKIKQFMVFCDYINEVGRVYRKDLLRFIKDNIDRVYPVGEDIDFNKETKEELDWSSGILPTTKITSNKKATSYYGDVPPPAPDADAATQAQYKAKIKSVNNAIYNSVRNQVTNNPENPSLIIPSPFWFGGDLVKVSGDLDIRTTIPESFYTELLALEQTFEKEVFNAKAPQLFIFLVNGLRELKDTFDMESQFIAQVIKAQAGQPVDNDANTQALQAEYQRQYNANATLHLMEKTYDNDRVEDAEQIQRQAEKGFKWVNMKVRDFKEEGGKTAFQNWVVAFVKSEEYDDFVKSKNIALVDADVARDKEYEEKMNPKLDIKKLAESKTFYNADVFEDEDQDSLNTDLIAVLRKQEEEFNKTIQDLQAPFTAEQEAQKQKNQEALEALKTKIQGVSADMFKKLDEGMAVNKQNRVKRQDDEAKRIIEEDEMEEEEGALASLRNYKGCTGGPPREPTPERVYQDVNLQDIIAQSEKQLSGGRKKRNTIAQQVYLLNKRYVDSNGFESPMVRTNSARKEGGATRTETTNVDPALNIQGATTDYIDTAKEEKEIADMELATNILGAAEMVVGFIPVVGDLLSAVMGIANMVMGDEIKKKEKELEEKRKENERLLDSWYAWKDNMESQVVLTLSTQEDPEVYKVMKANALDSFRNMNPGDPPTSREIRAYSKQIDDERNNIITSRKNITDQIAQNAQDITGVIADTLESQDTARTDLVNEGFEERKKIIDAFTTQLKDYIKKFMDEQTKLDEEDRKVEEQANKVSEMVEDKEEELEDEAEDIAQLKGYSGCKANVKSNEELRDEAEEELEEQQRQLEEQQAQGTVPIQGLGKRYKNKKNSIANQVYMLNMRFIKSF
jgi:hypothetical protein